MSGLSILRTIVAVHRRPPAPTITYVQSAVGSSPDPATTATSVGVAFSSNCTSGNFLVCGIVTSGADTISSVTDTLGNTWSLVHSYSGQFPSTYLYACRCGSSGANTVTVAISSADDYVVSVAEFSGIVTSSWTDQTLHGLTANTLTLALGPTGTTVQAKELAICLQGARNTGTAVNWGATATGWTDASNKFTYYGEIGGGLSYQILNAAGTVSVSKTFAPSTATSTAVAGIIATFKGA